MHREKDIASTVVSSFVGEARVFAGVSGPKWGRPGQLQLPKRTNVALQDHFRRNPALARPSGQRPNTGVGGTFN
jgi:hypothetical protein